MAFALHSRVSFGGRLRALGNPAYDEIWQCNVNVVNATLGDGFDNGAYLESMAPNLLTWFSNPLSGNSGGATLDWVKCNAINPDGSYFDKTHTNVHDYGGDFTSGGSTPVNPDIISVATTWLTDKARGPGSHGRIYLPNNTYGEQGTMGVSGSDQLKAATAGRALLIVINNDAGAPAVRAVVASKVNATNTEIRKVAVGSIKDVQRRRKDALKESYVSVSMP